MDKKTSQEIVNMALIILYFLSKLVPELPFWVSSILNISLNSSLYVTINNDWILFQIYKLGENQDSPGKLKT